MYTTHKIHAKLHENPGPDWHISHTLSSEDIDDIISRFFCANSQFVLNSGLGHHQLV